jgi:DNA ligase-associated metallophosphoesterase
VSETNDPVLSQVQHSWAGQHFKMDAPGSLYWEEKNTLIISDVHFGKIGHFRKYGFAIPQAPFNVALDKLDFLIKAYEAERLIILGDLFHSDYNKEFDYLEQWLAKKSNLKTELVPGNHDRYAAEYCGRLGITCLEELHEEAGILFVHDPADERAKENSLPRIAGHLHPGVRMRGGGRQSLRLACFFFSEKLSLMPAFGAFTGKSRIQPQKGDRVFVIANDRVVPVEVNK